MFYFGVTLLTTLAIASANLCPVRQLPSRAHQIRMGNTHHFYKSIVPGHALDGNVHSNVTTSSHVTCAVLCLQQEACKSFNYCKADKLCQLNTAAFMENKNALHITQDCFYFDEGHDKDIAVVRFVSPCTVYWTAPDRTLFIPGPLIVPVLLNFTIESKHNDIKAVLTLYSVKPGSANYTVTLISAIRNVYIETSFEGDTYTSTQSGFHFANRPLVVSLNTYGVQVNGVEESLSSKDDCPFKPGDGSVWNLNLNCNEPAVLHFN